MVRAEERQIEYEKKENEEKRKSHLMECLDGREDLLQRFLLEMVLVHAVQHYVHHVGQQILNKHYINLYAKGINHSRSYE